MDEVHALVEMTVPSDEFGDIEMTPAILDEITAIQDAALRCAQSAAHADYSAFSINRNPRAFR
jgi:hypothetical protein